MLPAMRSSLAIVLVFLTACGSGKSTAPTPSSGGAPAAGAAPGATDGAGAAGGESPSAATPAEAAAPSGPAPDKMDGALPETKDIKAFPRRYECKVGGCNLAKLIPDDLKGQLEKDAPIFFYEIVMPPKVMMLFPRHAGVDLYGILTDGEVSVLADDIKEKQKRAWKMNGFRAPGAGVNIYSKEPTKMLVAIVVNGTSGSVADAVDKIGKDKSISWSKRSSPVTSFELSQKADVAWGGGAYHARLAYEQGADNPPASMSFLMMSKNASVPEHTHDKEWEFLAILDGDGEMTRKTGGKTPVKGSTFVSIAPGVPHAFKPSGSTPTMAVQMYWPPGPEQRFKKLAEGNK